MFKWIKRIVRLKGNVINNTEKCVYCGICEKVCPYNAIKVNEKTKTWVIDNKACRRCEKCVRKCPQKSLSIIKD